MALTTKNGGGDNGNGELAMGMKLRDIDHSDDNNGTVELKEWCKEQLAQLGSLVQVFIFDTLTSLFVEQKSHPYFWEIEHY
jgi:hypothetical protein